MKKELQHAKLPPQNLDVEEILLGCLMIEQQSFNEISTLLSPEVFYKESHGILFSCIQEMFNDGTPIDIATVTDRLKNKGDEVLNKCGGPYGIVQLTARVSGADNIREYAAIILQSFIQREIIRIGSGLVKSGYEGMGEKFESFEQAKKAIGDIEDLFVKNKIISFQSQLSELWRSIESSMKSGKNIPGQETGYPDVDKITGGRCDGDLIIIAGRPSMGKTTYAINEFLFIARFKPVLFFSLEMSAIQINRKLLSIESGVDHEKIRTGKLSSSELSLLTSATTSLEKLMINIQDCSTLSISDFRAICRKMKRTHSIGAVYVDYIQLMDGEKKGSRDLEIGSITSGMKKIAKELQIPVVGLSQLNRAVEATSDKRPLLSHLRESGSIEQDADVVQFIFRPEYYGIREMEIFGEGMVSTSGVMETNTAKNRAGKTDYSYLRFLGDTSKVANRGSQNEFKPMQPNRYEKNEALF